MGREIACPQCGAQHRVVNPGITMLVCDHCHAALYFSEDEAIKIGRESILPESDARLFLGATGVLDGRRFEAVGHVRYDYGRGTWDEWYVQMEDGGVAWFNEAERELTLETAATIDERPSSQLQVGDPAVLDGETFTVREIATATCVGGAGQLPFAVEPGETYQYADLATQDGSRIASLEFDEDGLIAFVGTPVGHDRLQIHGEAPPQASAAAQGRSIVCANCGGSLETPGNREVVTLVCEYCGARIDLSQGQQNVLGVNQKKAKKGFAFKIGQAGTFDGVRYEVCGRMRYDDDGDKTREYLLFHPDHGYLWLAEEDGHFVLNRPSEASPGADIFYADRGSRHRIGGRRYRLYETGSVKLDYVDGALPWRADVGDTFRYADLIAPPYMFGVEGDGNEVESFEGRYLTQWEVYEAFDCQGLREFPEQIGIHPAQPFRRHPGTRVMLIAATALAVLNVVFMQQSFSKRSTKVFDHTFSAQEYKQGVTSAPFTLPKSPIITVETQAPVDNSWVWSDMAFMSAGGKVVAEATSQDSYYHGYDDGYWTEGHTYDSKDLRAPPAGTYRLLVKGEGGSGSRGPALNEPLRVRIYAGTRLAREFLIMFLICALFPIGGLIQRRMFKQQKWEDD